MEIQKTKLDNFIKNDNIPNLLIYGPHLCGKEEICDNFINKIYKTNELKEKYVLKINCVSIKGIKMIKENIKLFSMQIINKKSNIYFKTIILYHAEFLTYDSQYSLRRTIEQFSHNTRFILLCQDKTNILSPILSRFVHIYINNSKNNSIITSNQNYTKLNKYFTKYNEIIEKDVDVLNNIYHLSTDMYNDNIFALEILPRFKSHKNYNKIKMIFEKQRSNFRNETLSIFYILSLFRNNQDFEIYDLY